MSGFDIDWLESEYAEVMALYEQQTLEYARLADSLGVARFSSLCKKELMKIIPDPQKIILLESIARVGGYTDEAELKRLRSDVLRQMAANGVRSARGKRPKIGMSCMVNDLAPILLSFGLPCSAGEWSSLVTALRIIASEIGLEGDPRCELRRIERASDFAASADMPTIRCDIGFGIGPIVVEATPPPISASLRIGNLQKNAFIHLTRSIHGPQ